MIQSLFGHDYGDKVLKLLCYTIQSEINLMKETYLIRMGGDDTTLIFQWESNSAQAYLKKFMSDETIRKVKAKTSNFSYLKWFSFGNGLLRPACASYRDEVSGGDFYVLPSSIHEVLFIADDGSMELSHLEEMVRSINEAEVAPADRLSDNVFHYDSEEHIFENARTFEAREAARGHERYNK